MRFAGLCTAKEAGLEVERYAATFGDLAAAAEQHKRHGDPKSSWSYALQHHPDLTNGNHVFVPFGAEISGSSWYGSNPPRTS